MSERGDSKRTGRYPFSRNANERTGERGKDKDGQAEGSSLVSQRGAKAVALLPADDGGSPPGERGRR